MECPKCKQQFEGAACPYCQVPIGEQVDTPQQSGANPYTAPAPVQEVPQYQNYPAANEGDGTGGVIPYKNPKALIAYYLGIISGLPLIGLPFGIAAFVLGILGLKARKRNPVIKGSAHAWIGIGCGGLFTILWGLLIVTMIGAALFN